MKIIKKQSQPDSIKKIAIADLSPGMHIHDMDGGWMSHDFLRTNFAVKNEKILNKVRKSGLKHVYIDTARGLDVESNEAVAKEVDQQFDELVSESNLQEKQVSVAEELEEAKILSKKPMTSQKI